MPRLLTELALIHKKYGLVLMFLQAESYIQPRSNPESFPSCKQKHGRIQRACLGAFCTAAVIRPAASHPKLIMELFCTQTKRMAMLKFEYWLHNNSNQARFISPLAFQVKEIHMRIYATHTYDIIRIIVFTSGSWHVLGAACGI
jgi:hypothetical protein